MIVLITICYIVCVLVAFKVIKIKVSPVSVAVATLIGVFILGGIVIGWKQSAPMTGQMIIRRRVLQVNPDVREFVSKVHVKPNQLVKKGEPLFEILADRFQDAVDQSTADLAAAKAKVSQLQASVAAASAAVKSSADNTAIAKAQLDTAVNIQKESAGAVAKLRVTQAEDAYDAAVANDKLAAASLKQTKLSRKAAELSVDVAKAGLNTANFNLEECTYRSPVDGQIVNWQIREGTPMARWRFTAVGTVQDFSNTAVLAVFPQNLLKNVKSGDDVEIAFKRRPGRIATGKVVYVVKYTGEGQFVASGKLPSAASVGSKGYLVVKIKLDDDELARKLPLGAAGTTAIYTDVGKPFHAITKIALRMKGWLYYLPI